MKTTSRLAELIEEQLGRLQVGTARTFGGLTVFPLLGDTTGPSADAEPRYLTLDRALEANAIRITEISDHGSVPTLRLENLGDRPVLLLDGEELAGAKQNRVLNLTILAPAHTTITIPVSCVEAGRWSRESAQFSSLDHVMYSKGRREKLAQVSSAMRHLGSRSSDQGAVWDSIQEVSRQYGVDSSTSKLADVYRAKRRQVNDYVGAFEPVHGQIGAAFVLGGRVRGVELFDHPRTLRELYGKLVRSWALDAMAGNESPSKVPDSSKVRAFLAKIAKSARDASEHDAVGLGTDLRLSGKRLVGSVLVSDADIVHLCAFRAGGRMDDDGSGTSPDAGGRRGSLSRSSGRIASASTRRGRYEQ